MPLGRSDSLICASHSAICFQYRQRSEDKCDGGGGGGICSPYIWAQTDSVNPHFLWRKCARTRTALQLPQFPISSLGFVSLFVYHITASSLKKGFVSFQYS